MAETTPSGCSILPFKVVFWDSEEPGFAGTRVRFSENGLLTTRSYQALPAAWRSDRRCRFPVEIGLRLRRPCRLQELLVLSEPGLAPSALECFVAGPTRSGAERTDSADAARTDYLSSVFVSAGRAEFALINAESTPSVRKSRTRSVASSRTSLSSSSAFPTVSSSAALPMKVPSAMEEDGIVAAEEEEEEDEEAAPSVAVLSGLTFKGQFVRLVLSEAAGSIDNPGRQVSITHIQISGHALEDEHPPGRLQRAARPSGATTDIRHLCDHDQDGDGELERVLLDLGIEPLLAHGSSSKQPEEGQGGWSPGVALHEQSGGVAAREGCNGWRSWRRGGGATEIPVVAEATRKVKHMLHIAQTEERFHEAELLSLHLDRIRSLGSKLGSARGMQEEAAKREKFDDAKRFRDEALEAEVWLRQAVRDASDIFNGAARGRAAGSTTAVGGDQGATPPEKERRLPLGGGECRADENRSEAPGGAATATPGSDSAAAVATATATATTAAGEEPAPSHGAGSDRPAAEAGDGPPRGLTGEQAGRPSSPGDCGGREQEPGEYAADLPPWLNPSCARSTQPWKDVLLQLPWPAGVQPDFGTVFCHGWAFPSGGGRSLGNVWGGLSSDLERTAAPDAKNGTKYSPTRWSAKLGQSGGGDCAGDYPARRALVEPSRLLRTILRLVAGSQDLRPPGPVPPDVAPFRRARNSCGRPPLCDFLLASSASRGEGRGSFPSMHHNNNDSNNMSYPSIDQIDDISTTPFDKPGGRKSSDISSRVNSGRSSDSSMGSSRRSQPLSNDAEIVGADSDQGIGNINDIRKQDIGRAFGRPAADRTPSATHVVNYIEDNADLAWGGLESGPFDNGIKRWPGEYQGPCNAGGEVCANESVAKIAAESATGGSSQKRVPQVGVGESESVGGKASTGNAIRSGKWGREDRVGNTEEAVTVPKEAAAVAAAASVERSESATAWLPDIVGAGGFAEFIPLLDTIIGRVPVSAACAGFPAKVRESSIRICRRYLDLTADVALEAFNAATAVATAKPTSSFPSNSKNAMPLAIRHPGSDTESGKGSRVGKISERQEDEDEETMKRVKIGIRKRSGSCSRRDYGSTIGAVVRAACLVAAQALMDPNRDVRHAGEDLARSALSLSSSAPAAVGRGARNEGGGVMEGGVNDEAAVDSDVEKAGTGDAFPVMSPSDGVNDGRGNAAADRNGRGSGATGSDRSRSGAVSSSGGGSRKIMVGPGRTRKTGRATDAQESEATPTNASNATAQITSTPVGPGDTAKDAVRNPRATGTTVAAVPLRDLRWGLELVLACVAPYLADGAVLDDESGEGGTPMAEVGNTDGPGGDESHRRSTATAPSIRKESRSAFDQDLDGRATNGSVAGTGGVRGRPNRNHGDAVRKAERARRSKSRLLEEVDGDRDSSDADRALLALRVVDFACRRPDIGPALVSSILVSWIPWLVQGGRTERQPEAAPATSTVFAFVASPPATPEQKMVDHASMYRSPRPALFTAGESAASEALAAGAFHMLLHMVRNFPLLPFSDFSAETLVGVAEGGMTLGGCVCSAGGRAGNDRRQDGGERRRNDDASVRRRVPAAAQGFGGGNGTEYGHRSGQQSSTGGRAREAGEALMLEIFLWIYGGDGDGGVRGGAGLGIDGCIDSLLPALNTARGIQFLDKTSATAALLAQNSGRAGKRVLAHSDKTEERAERLSMTEGTISGITEAKGRFGEKGDLTNLVKTQSRLGVSSSTAPRGQCRTRIQRRSYQQPVTADVEVRRRLRVPVSAMFTADRRSSSSAISHRSYPSEPNSSGEKTDVFGEDDGAAGQLAKHDEACGVDPQKFESASGKSEAEKTRSTPTAGLPSKRGGIVQGSASAKAVSQQATTDNKRNKSRVFPHVSSGGKNDDSHEFSDQSSAGDMADAAAVMEAGKHLETSSGQTRAEKGGGGGGGGFMGALSRIFGRGK